MRREDDTRTWWEHPGWQCWHDTYGPDCPECVHHPRPTERDEPAYVMTKDGPQLLLPGTPVPDETKGDTTQTRMF